MTRALVIGGGIAGLCAARVLADHHDEVIILERDRYPADIRVRRGVPQGQMYHTLIERGRREVEKLFPGFHALLDDWGVPRAAGGFNIAYMTPRGWGKPIQAAVQTAMSASRPLIEAAIRKLALEIPNIRVIEERLATGLIADQDAGHPICRGVTVRSPEGSERIDADLVVDASGGGSRAPQWLKDIGLSPPDEEQLDPMLTYGSQWLRLRPDATWPARWWWTHGVFLQRIPPHDINSAHLMLHENGRWMLTMVTAGDGQPPTEPEQIAEFLAGLRSPLIAQMYPLFEPVTKVVSYRLSKNRWRHFERWGERLDGFLALGDAVCVFNPNLGQGMSAASAEAGILRECLRRTIAPAELPKLFFAAQARFQAGPWGLSTSNDLRFDTVMGKRTARVRAFNWYRQQLILASWWRVQRRLAQVDLLLKPARTIFNPLLPAMAAASRAVPRWRDSYDPFGPYPPAVERQKL